MIEVNSSPTSAVRISLQTETNSKSFPVFVKNEVVEGKVLKTFPRGKALLLIKGKSVMARTYSPLKENRVLSLRVENIFPNPTLKTLETKLAGSDTPNISAILSSLKDNVWESVFKKIDRYALPKEAVLLFKKLMNDLSMRLYLKPDSELLKLIINKSGVSLEAKLRKALIYKTIRSDNLNKLIEGDLKGLVSRLLIFRGEKEILLKRFISTLKNIQLLNCLGMEQDRKIFLPIPMQFPNGFFTTGQLLICLPQKGKGESPKQKSNRDTFRITFLLELSNLGPLRADLIIIGKEIEGRFLLTTEEARRLVEKNIPIFADKITEKSFSIRHIQCRLEEPEIVTRTLVNEITQEEGGSISLLA